MVKEKTTTKNIIAYLQGNFRYKLFYSKYFHWLMRSHIREQIEYRINSMNRTCFENGSCIKCGCQTTHLQMANKSCRGECYPRMHDSHLWKTLIASPKIIWEGFHLDNVQCKFIKKEI